MRAVVIAILWSAILPSGYVASPSGEPVRSAAAFAPSALRRASPELAYSSGERRRERVAPQTFRVRLDTSKGAIVIEVHREWTPHGADRFYELVTAGYFDDNRFFRVHAGQWAQFGINGDPAVAKRWRARPIPDDPRQQSNVRGMVAFAFAEPNARTTQVYIALKDLSDPQDAQGFAPFGRVVEGMDVADALNSEYGENSGGGIRAGQQQPLFDGGNAYMDRAYPRLDRILHAKVIP
jgi:homoserine O-acetyltransferase